MSDSNDHDSSSPLHKLVNGNHHHHDSSPDSLIDSNNSPISPLKPVVSRSSNDTYSSARPMGIRPTTDAQIPAHWILSNAPSASSSFNSDVAVGATYPPPSTSSDTTKSSLEKASKTLTSAKNSSKKHIKKLSFKGKKHPSSLASGEASIVASSLPPSKQPSNDKSNSSKSQSNSNNSNGTQPDNGSVESSHSYSVTDKLIDRLVASSFPTSSFNLETTEKRANYMKSSPNFSIQIMSRNFRNMTARTGVVYETYYMFLHIITWQTSTLTLSVLGLYSLIVLHPKLISVLPFLFVLLYLMVPSYTFRHPPDPTIIFTDFEETVIEEDSDSESSHSHHHHRHHHHKHKQSEPQPAPKPQSNNPSSSTDASSMETILFHKNPSPVVASGPPLGDAVVPKPVPELSREFYMNMVDTQNAMVLYIQAYDYSLQFLRQFAFFEGDEATSSFMYVLLMFGSIISYIAMPFVIRYTPWKLVFLSAGWALAIKCHPKYRDKVLRLKTRIKRTSARGRKTLKKVVTHIKRRSSSTSSSFGLGTSKSETSISGDETTTAKPKTTKTILDDISIDGVIDSEDESYSDSYDSDSSSTCSTCSSKSSISEESEEDSNSEKVNDLDRTISESSTTSSSSDLSLAPSSSIVKLLGEKINLAKIAYAKFSKEFFVNPMNDELWKSIHSYAYKEFHSNSTNDQRQVEVFEIQFSRAKSFYKYLSEEEKKDYHHPRYTNWESSLYTNEPFLPKTKLSLYYPTNSSQAQLQKALSTLETDPVELKDQKLTDEIIASAAASAAVSSEPFIIPGLVSSLREIKPPPFWQYIPGGNWKMDLDVLDWVASRGIALDIPTDFISQEGNEEDYPLQIFSSDGTISIEVGEKWVYDEIPIDLQAESTVGTFKKTASGETNEAPKEGGDIIWMRRRRWVRSCTRSKVVKT